MGAGGVVGEDLDEARVLGGGLEHERGPGDAAGFEVEDDGGLLARGVGAGVGLRAEEAHLLAVGDEHDDVVAVGPFEAQGAGGLDDGGDPGGGVGGAGAGGHGVVVGGEEDGAGGVGAGEGGHDVVHEAEAHEGVAFSGVAGEFGLDLDVEAEGFEVGGEEVADAVVLGSAHRVGLDGHGLDGGPGAVGAELVGGGVGRGGRGRRLVDRPVGDPDERQGGQDGEGGPGPRGQVQDGAAHVRSSQSGRPHSTAG
nr:hypothetical protein GCM10025732_34120 [Glycomyces mayteni]